MKSEKVEFYNSLSTDEQYILNVSALYGMNIDSNRIRSLVPKTKSIPENLIKKTLKKGLESVLLTQEKYGYISVSPDFMIFVFPKLKEFNGERLKISDDFRFNYGPKPMRNLSLFLSALLHNIGSIEAQEINLLNDGIQFCDKVLWTIFDNKEYHKSLQKLNENIINQLINSEILNHYSTIEPLSIIDKKVEKIKPYLSESTQSKLKSPKGMMALCSGNFKEAVEIFSTNNPSLVPQINGTEFLLNNNINEAAVAFEKGLKSQRAEFKSRQIPILSEFCLYYYTVLLCLPPEKSSPIFDKINTSLEKKTLYFSDNSFKAVGYFALNQKRSFEAILGHINQTVESNHIGHDHLINCIIYYLIDHTPSDKQINNCFLAVEKAFQNGYTLIAYEAAYCLFQWSSNTKIKSLYDQIAAQFPYPPAVSQIVRLDNWEKTLNGLLQIGGEKKSTITKSDESKSRVIYYIEPLENIIQPTLQTRTKNGWSNGRNLALKTFGSGTVDGMTDQDIRLSKKIEHTARSYYGSEDYFFKEDALKELIGHPLLFLSNARDIQMELVKGEPTIEVIKTKRGYQLKSDIDNGLDKIFIEKETNTRYKVYVLTPQQRAIIRAINADEVVVPDKGREKLMQVLTQFSTHISVHSDLIVSDNNQVRNVETDSRIRVQLLPLGDGIKAELFAKPFGTHPPYCKPGLGGKTLIYNDKGDQIQVLRDLKMELVNANELMAEIQTLDSFEINDGLIAFENPLDSLNLLDILSNHLHCCVVEWPEGEKFKIIGSAGFSQLKFNIKSKSGWFDLQGELKVNESTVISIQELLLMNHKSKSRFIELENGAFLALSEQLKKQLNELYSYSSSGKDGLQINPFAAMALTDFFDEVKDLKTDKIWKEFQTRVKKSDELNITIPSNLQAELRPYQEEGYRWLARLAEWEAGACLADDMGLGKTIQTLAILLHRSPLGAALVVCPVSVVPNWINEVAKFAPTLTIKTLDSGNREQILSGLEASDLLITSYGILQSEEKALTDIRFSTIVLDEAHAIKNFTTKTSKAAMQLKASFRIALTGTPIQNHLGEMWNLFNFINPGLLGTQTQFTDTFIKSDNDQARKHLKKLIAPFILRRLKSNVLDELPPKTEIVKKIELSPQESAYYEALRRQAIINMESDDSEQGTKHLKALAEITRLRQACCNIALVDKTANIASSKLATFLEIAEELIENKHRALVFSQFVTHLALVQNALDKKGISYQYLDGQTSMAEREQRVKKFQAGEGDLFLISLKAGGLGINLTAADYVIHLDPWWNPAIEDQASDRAHRYGQNKPVTIYRLVAENTIEEKIIELHNTKRNLADSLLEGSDQSAKLSINELVALITDKH